MAALSSRLPYRLNQSRSFVDAKVKWVRDPYLDYVVEREKNLKQVLFLKDQILSSPAKAAPISSVSLLKPYFDLPTSASKFCQKYSSVFSQFQPRLSLPIHVKLTHQAITLHKEELAVHSSPSYRDNAVRRLAKLLMLTRATKLPLHVINKFRLDLGLPHDYITSLLADYPEYFQVCEVKDCRSGENTLGLEVVSWRYDLAVSEMERREAMDGLTVRKGLPLRFSMNLPRGFDLQKKVRSWVEKWQDLPYVSPYEDAFHLGPSSDQAEKWTVAVLHELLWLLVSKKTEQDNLLCLGDYLGFGLRFKKALAHHPGIFYVSNKIRTQTVVLREAYKKDFLLVKHPLMGMRYRYIHLMNKAKKKRKLILLPGIGNKSKVALSADKGEDRKEGGRKRKGEEQANRLSDSEFDDDAREDEDEDGNGKGHMEM